MPRAKKSARLLQKLNRSLEGDAPAIAESTTTISATRPAVAEKIEVLAPAAENAAIEQALSPVVAAEPVNPAAPAPSPAGRRVRAEEIVRHYLPFAVGAGLIPLPGVDLVAVGGLQLKMLGALARHYDVAFTRAQGEAIVTSLLGSVGGTVVASSALGSMVKFFPGLGTLLSLATLPIASSVVTLAIGRLAIDHFEAGGTMSDFDLDLAQQAFERKLAEAKRALT